VRAGWQAATHQGVLDAADERVRLVLLLLAAVAAVARVLVLLHLRLRACFGQDAVAAAAAAAGRLGAVLALLEVGPPLLGGDRRDLAGGARPVARDEHHAHHMPHVVPPRDTRERAWRSKAGGGALAFGTA
jgi:hypothetical protein